MSELIGGYRPITPLKTVGSGSARWCFAARGLERYFLKQFLSPVYPANPNSALGRKQCERCERFENRKQRLYAALSLVIGDTLVPVLDFFRFEGHYYAVSEAVSSAHITAGEAQVLSEDEKRGVLFRLALCLQRLHTQGVVHADLKPEHVLLMKNPGGYLVRLIDLDSGFLRDEPPKNEHGMEGDPVYLAPEAFLRMTGMSVPLTPKLDTFAFGAIIHHLWTGELPSFDTARYAYLYEAVLDGARISLSQALPPAYATVIRRMLSADPDQRPGDTELTALFAPSITDASAAQPARQLNGLGQFFKR